MLAIKIIIHIENDFTNVNEKTKLNIIRYNKSLQDKLNINIMNIKYLSENVL